MRTRQEYQDLVNRSLEGQLRSLGNVPDRLMDAMLYSLIHDDLPGMDNDDQRRGRPTNHIVFGEGMAILAGDGLLNAAMETVLRASVRMGDLRGIRAAEQLARHAGVTGMIAGQTLDVTMEGQVPTEEAVTRIHMHKTADMIQAPVEMGLTLAGSDPASLSEGSEFGLHFGIAFQIIDDVLDVVGDPALLGKKTGMDEDKLTWVALRGVEQARLDARTHTEAAVAALKRMPWDTAFLENLARDNLTRMN